MASLIERTKQAWRALVSKELPPSSQGFVGGMPGYGRLGSFSNASSGLIKIIDNAIAKYGDQNVDPYPNLKVYYALDRALPFLQRARNIRADIKGNHFYTSEDPVLENELNDYQETFRIENEFVQDHQGQRGLSNFFRTRTRERLLSGQFFDEIYTDLPDQQGIPIGTRCFDPGVFQYNQDENQRPALYFNSMSGPVRVKPSLWFTSSKQEPSPRYYWGTPMCYGMEFVANLLLRLMITRQDTHARIANPPGVWLFSTTPESVHKFGAELEPMIKDAKAKFESAFGNAIRRAKETGFVDDLAISLPGTTLDYKIFGQGMTGLTEYPEEFNLLANMVILNTGVPMEFLGFGSGGGGIGSDKFKILVGLLQSNANSERIEDDNYAERLGRLWLLKTNSPATAMKKGAFGHTWELPNINDEAVEAQTSLVSAQAFAAHLENFLMLQTQFATGDEGMEAAEQYATNRDIPELQGLSLVDIPKPDPLNPDDIGA